MYRQNFPRKITVKFTAIARRRSSTKKKKLLSATVKIRRTSMQFQIRLSHITFVSVQRGSAWQAVNIRQLRFFNTDFIITHYWISFTLLPTSKDSWFLRKSKLSCAFHLGQGSSIVLHFQHNRMAEWHDNLMNTHRRRLRLWHIRFA